MFCIPIMLVALVFVAGSSGRAFCLDEAPREPDLRVALFIAQVSSDDVDTRKRAVDGLAKLGAEAVGAVPVLLAKLADEKENDRVRAAAARGLAKIDPDGKQCLPALRRAVRDKKNIPVCLAAVRALGELGAAAAEGAGDLAALLPASWACGPVFSTASRLGPDAAVAFLEVAESNDRAAPLAAWCLICMGASAEPAIDRLIEKLASKPLESRLRAARLLGDLAPAAAKAAPVLQAVADDPDPQLSKLASGVLKAIEASQREPLATLRRKYFGKIRTGRTTELVQQMKLMNQLMKEWNPTGITVEELLSVCGAPSAITPEELYYVFDSGPVAVGYVYQIKDGCVVTWRRAR